MIFSHFSREMAQVFDLLKQKNEKFDPRNWEALWRDSPARWVLKFLAQAIIASADSTCLNRNTGACLVDIRVQQNGDLSPFALSSCFNGAPTGIEPCSKKGFCHYKMLALSAFKERKGGDRLSWDSDWKEEFKEFKASFFQYCIACHAEMNAIYFSPVPAFSKLLFATTDPCPECARLIVQQGIGAVIYTVPYKADQSGPKLAEQSRYLFEEANIPCINIPVPKEYFPWIFQNIQEAGQGIFDPDFE